MLDEWQVERPRGWMGIVDDDLTQAVQARIKTSLERDRPLGSDAWAAQIAKRLGLLFTINRRGRPKKTPNA